MNEYNFSNRLKELIHTKRTIEDNNGRLKNVGGYNYRQFAEKIHVSESSVKQWCSGQSQPPLSTLIDIADHFHVDLNYLLGKQDCKELKTQIINNLYPKTLNEESSKTLLWIGQSERTARIFNDLLNHPDFKHFLLEIARYAYSFNDTVSVQSSIDPEDKMAYTESQKQGILKFSVSDHFSRILDDIYEKHKPEQLQLKAYSLIKEMIDEISLFIPIPDYFDAEKIKSLCYIINVYLDRIREVSPDAVICKFTPQQIIDNFQTIKESLWVS